MESSREKRHSEENNEDGHEEKRQKTSENQFVPTAGGLSSNNAGTGAAAAAGPTKSSFSSQPDTRKVIEQLHPITGDVLRTYPGGSDAAKFMSISQGGISLCCHGKQADANGFCWRFYDGPPIVWNEAFEARQMSLEQLKAIQQQKLKAVKPKEGDSSCLTLTLTPILCLYHLLQKKIAMIKISHLLYYSLLPPLQQQLLSSLLSAYLITTPSPILFSSHGITRGSRSIIIKFFLFFFLVFLFQ